MKMDILSNSISGSLTRVRPVHFQIVSNAVIIAAEWRAELALTDFTLVMEFAFLMFNVNTVMFLRTAFASSTFVCIRVVLN